MLVNDDVYYTVHTIVLRFQSRESLLVLLVFCLYLWMLAVRSPATVM